MYSNYDLDHIPDADLPLKELLVHLATNGFFYTQTNYFEGFAELFRKLKFY